MRGKAISEFRSPNALPRAPTPLGTEGVLRCCKCIVADFCLYATEFKVERCAELVPGFFDIYAGRLCRYSHTFTLPGQDAPRPLPSPPRILCFFLPAGNASLRERISVRAVAEEGGYNLGCGRGRYCGRVSCLSQRRVLALPQWF